MARALRSVEVARRLGFGERRSCSRSWACGCERGSRIQQAIAHSRYMQLPGWRRAAAASSTESTASIRFTVRRSTAVAMPMVSKWRANVGWDHVATGAFWLMVADFCTKRTQACQGIQMVPIDREKKCAPSGLFFSGSKLCVRRPEIMKLQVEFESRAEMMGSAICI